MTTSLDNPASHELTKRRNLDPNFSTNLSSEVSNIASIGQAIGVGQHLDIEQIQTFHRILNTEITILDEELRGVQFR
jgi:sterol O-acyltransferase